MDRLSTKAEFARNATESHRIIALMRVEVGLNSYAIDQSRKAIGESRDMLDRPDEADS